MKKSSQDTSVKKSSQVRREVKSQYEALRAYKHEALRDTSWPHKRPASALRARATCLESSDAHRPASKEEEEEERGAGEARAERGRASVTTAASTRAVQAQQRPSEHPSVYVSSSERKVNR